MSNGEKLEDSYNDILKDIKLIFPFYPFRQKQKDARNEIMVFRKDFDELNRLVQRLIREEPLTKEEQNLFVQIHNKMLGAERLTVEEFRLIWQTVGSYDMDYIGDFLMRFCNVPQSELNNISWPNILKRLKSLRHSLLQGKKLLADLASKKQNGKTTEKWFRNRTIQAAIISAAVLIILTVLGWIINSRIKNQSSFSQKNISTSLNAETKGNLSPVVVTYGPNSSVSIYQMPGQSDVNSANKETDGNRPL